MQNNEKACIFCIFSIFELTIYYSHASGRSPLTVKGAAVDTNGIALSIRSFHMKTHLSGRILLPLLID